jgi:hypothetical protein
MIPSQAPSALHGRLYNRRHSVMPTQQKQMCLYNVLGQAPQLSQQMVANKALRQHFLDTQVMTNVRNEYERLKGRLSEHRDPFLNDGRALKPRLDYLQKQLDNYNKQSQPIIGATGSYLYQIYSMCIRTCQPFLAMLQQEHQQPDR